MINMRRVSVSSLRVRRFSTHPAAYTQYLKMLDEHKKKYPFIFLDEKQDVQMQQKLIDNCWEPKTLKANVEVFNSAYQDLCENHGLALKTDTDYERVPKVLRQYFKDIDYDFILPLKPAAVALPTEDRDLMNRKMTTVAELLEQFKDTFKVPENISDSDYNMLLVKRDTLKLDLKRWLFRVQDVDDDKKTWSGLPFDQNMMMEMFNNVKYQRNRDWLDLTSEQKDVRMLEVVQEVWDTIYDEIIVHTQPDRTKKEFDQFRDVYFQVFDPEAIYHYRLKDVAKIMFLQAYWAGGDKKVFQIEKEIENLVTLYNDTPADYLELWKETFRNKPNAPLSGEVTLMVKALDTKFIPTLLNKVRNEFAGSYFVKTAQQVLTMVYEDDYAIKKHRFDSELAGFPSLESAKATLREELAEFGDRVDDVTFRQKTIAGQIAALNQEHKDSLDMPLPPIEEMFETLVKEEFWVSEDDPRADDVQKFSKKLLEYAKSGKGDIVALEKEAKELLPKNLIPEYVEAVNKLRPDDMQLKTGEIYSPALTGYIQAERKRMDLWSFRNVFWAETGKTELGIKKKRSTAVGFLKGFDEIIVRTIKHLIEEGTMKDFVKITEDYGKIVKVFKGEVYGTVSTAKSLSDTEFNAIVDTLSKQNPGKKFFLTQEVDPTILAGFEITCGTDTLDYSLRSELSSL